MKLFSLPFFVLFVATVKCWSINDIYTQLLQGDQKNNPDVNSGNKRGAATNRLDSKALDKQSSNYEVKSYDVETSPIKKNFPAKPRSGSGHYDIKPTEGIKSFGKEKSMMDFNKKYDIHNKLQVSAWTEWSQKGSLPHPEAASQTRMNKKDSQVKRRLEEAAPTSAVNLFRKHAAIAKKENPARSYKNVKILLKNGSAAVGKTAVRSDTNQTAQSIAQFDQPEPQKNTQYSNSFEGPCVPTHDNICPTSPMVVAAEKPDYGSEKLAVDSAAAAAAASKTAAESSDKISGPEISTDSRSLNITTDALQANANIANGSVSSNTEDANAVIENAEQSATQNQNDMTDLPDVHRLLSENYSKKTFKLHDCHIEATSGACGARFIVNKNTCDGKVSFTTLVERLLGNIDLSGPSNELIVHGKFDATEFSVDRCKGHLSFNLTCRELLDIIPNKLRIAKAKIAMNFSYEQLPKAIAYFDFKINGILELNFRSRRLNVFAEKPLGTTLFKVDMTSADLELPEFTKLFTDAEISQQDLPPDLATLVTSSLRNPRITGLYDESGAFEFIASATSPASIFPSRPNIYVIIQKPRLGKVVSGLIASFESAMFRSFLSSILNQDLSNIPLFNDIRTDMAIGISPDGLFVVKDDNFNKEVGSLFNTGRTIKKGLTVKARLPIRKILTDLTKKSFENLPENTLINVEVKGEKMHIEFPDDFQIPLSKIADLFSQRGQDLNFPKQTNIDQTLLQIKSYEIDNIDKKSLSVYFSSNQPMKIGSLMSLNNVGATLKRDELSKWNFNANGDYKLGTTSVAVTLTGQTNGFIISSSPSSIRSGLLVDLLDQKNEIIKPEMSKYHMDDFVIDEFKVAGALNKKNIIRFSGKPAIFGVDDSKIEFIATEEATKPDNLAMGVLFRNVDVDAVFGRMLDRKMKRSSWATGVNVGLILSNVKNQGDLQFESDGLSKTKISPGAHLRCLLMRPESTLCKGDSLCRVLSEEMPHGSAFHLAGGLDNGIMKLSAPINGPISLSKSLQLHDASLHVNVRDSVNIDVLASMALRGIDLPFSGGMKVDNTGQLQLNMESNKDWNHAFGLKNVYFTQNNLSATFEPGLPVPTFDLRSKIVFGKDPTDASKSIEAVANSKINTQDPSKNSFTASLRDLSFEKLASASGTKKPLSRFQQEAQFTEEGLMSFDQGNKEERVEGMNETAYNYKGELKVSGRMHILGQNTEYTIKFLHGGSQLLTEVGLPDIGVDQGKLTIRAGLKQQSMRGEIKEPQAPNGPTLLIRMDPYMNSAVIVGKVSTLGFSRISAIKIEDTGFSAKIFGNLPGNVNSDISLRSDYTENIQNADFQVSSCLPIQQNIKASLMKLLQETATRTKKTLISAEERVTTTEKIYETTKAMIDKNKKRALDFTNDIRSRSEIMIQLRKGIKKHCVKDCGDSCMGLPTWRRSGITLAGRNAIGAPSWDSCRKKIPDLNCITRCLGRKVIENVKANNKQIELQGLMGSLAETKRSLQNARSLVERARKLVDSTLDGLEKVNKEIKVGVDISKFLNERKTSEAVAITNACFKDSLNNAERSLVKFGLDVHFTNSSKRFSVEAALDGNLEQSVAEGIANQLYPGYFEFSKKLEQVKVLLSNLDGEKAEIEKEIEKTANGIDQKSDQKSQIVWNTEEDDFRKLTYGELPRFTLSDDETIHAFEEKSIWEVAPTNNPLFDKTPGDSQIITNKVVDPDAFAEELNKQSNCGKIRSSVNRYAEIINPLSEFTENFLQEKIMFYRQKNRRLADLRMIDDQIKSDCFLENCTMEDMGNALSYLARARDGTLKWSNVIEDQIEVQNKAALGYFSNRTAEIIEADKGVSLRHYIAKVKEVVQNAIKKSDLGEKSSDTDDRIQKLAKELHSLLLGVKNSEELSKVAPKIFSMKRQIQNLKRNMIPCVEKFKENKFSDQSSGHKLHIVKQTIPINKTTSKPEAQTVPTRKETTTTTSKKPTKSQTTRPAPTETENPVLKDTVMRYDDNVLQKHANIDRMYNALNDKFTETELLDPEQQNVPQQYFMMNDPQSYQQAQTYNPYAYWDRYVKKK